MNYILYTMFLSLPETSVADRRKMFELAVSHEGGRETQSTISRPGLRQIKQDALTEYAERKREVKKEKDEQRSESRLPRANQQHVHSTHTGWSNNNNTVKV